MYAPQAPQYAVDPSPQKSPSRMPLILSIIALVFSCAAFILVFTKNPLGKGLDSYDFSTPEAALKSGHLIKMNNDLQAQIDLQRLMNGAQNEEALRTLEVNRVADFQDKKIVFFSYLKGGEKQKEYQTFEKDLESKLWKSSYVGRGTVRESNEQLANDMDAWDD